MQRPANASVVKGRAAYNPDTMINAISNTGYKSEEAMADLVDNPIEAGASEIEVLVHPGKGSLLRGSKITIADNGVGMDAATLQEALKLGTKRTRNLTEDKSLGEFGMGAKAASLSMGETMTYLTAQDGKYCIGHLSEEEIRTGKDLGFWVTPPQSFSEIRDQVSPEILDALLSICGGEPTNFTGTVLEISDLKKVKKSKNAKEWSKELCKPLGTIFSKMLGDDLKISVGYRGRREPHMTEVRPFTLHDLNPAGDGYMVNTFGKEGFFNLEVDGEQLRAKVIYFAPSGRGKKGKQKKRGQGVRIFRNGRLMNYNDIDTFNVWGRNDVFTGLYVDLLIPGDTKLVNYNFTKARPELEHRLVQALQQQTLLARQYVRKSAMNRAKDRETEQGSPVQCLDKKLSENSEKLALGPTTREKIDNANRKAQSNPNGRGPDLRPRKPRSPFDADFGYNFEISTEFVESELDPGMKVLDVKTTEEKPGEVKVVYNSENAFIANTLLNDKASHETKLAVHMLLANFAIAELEIQEDDNLRRSFKKIKQRLATNLENSAKYLDPKAVIE